MLRVERTADTGVLRWVGDHPALVNTPDGARIVPAGTPFQALLGNGDLVEIHTRNQELYTESPADRVTKQLASALSEALASCLANPGQHAWLFKPTEVRQQRPTIVAIQHLVNKAAGASMQTHGGTLTVHNITEDTVELLAAGACHGCSQSDATLLALIRPALVTQYPMLTQVVIVDGPTDHAQPVRLETSKHRGYGKSQDSSCH